MNFFGIGPGELILILVIALIVFGPGKLPEVGSALGKGIREFRRVTGEATQELTKSMEIETREVRPHTGRACAACGTWNPVSSKFCGQCGADLALSTTYHTPIDQ
ncbi:MAG: twin-arginine translocase TatA/TatE family subunit [Chloroflexi bacterium]|nr:twin-arginine translocase TatA/TatE family subunit [Chloroflexota bacterium]